MARMRTVAVLAALGIVLPAGVTSAAPVTSAVLPAALPPPAADAPRVAFTDDGDRLDVATIERLGGSFGERFQLEVGPDPLESGGVHDGEGTVTLTAAFIDGEVFETPVLAFVSTRDVTDGQPGDVYVRYTPYAQDSPVTLRVTSDPGSETHPVVSPDGTCVAFASDRDDDWDVVVEPLDLQLGPEPSENPPTCAAPARITDAAGDDLWPSWAPDGQTIVFSSTRDDPLGDIYRVSAAGVTDPDAGDDAARLTAEPSADSQPAVIGGLTGYDEAGDVTYRPDDGTPLWVAFTSTRDRTDGSLVAVDADGVAGLPITAASLWDPESSGEQDIPQASEASWSFGPDGRIQLAYTSTEVDPYGDVYVAELVDNWIYGPPFVAAGSDTPVLADAGVAESHPTWSGVFGATANEVELVHTRRTLAADVSDVVAADGSDRAVLAATTFTDDGGNEVAADDAGPSHSPDGARLAFSAETEGGYAVTLYERTAAGGVEIGSFEYSREFDDVDLDPVWSPDGSRIAFVRYNESVDDGAPRVMVLDLATGSLEDLGRDPVVVDDDDESTVDGTTYTHDVDPAWSPDGTRIAIARSTRFVPEPVVELTSAPSAATTPGAPGGALRGAHVTGIVHRAATTPRALVRPTAARAAPGFVEVVTDPEIWVLDAAGGPASSVDTLTVCPTPVCGVIRRAVVGRAPAWSHDGTTLAAADVVATTAEGGVENRHGVSLLLLADSTPGDRAPDVPEVAARVTPLTGFGVDGSPTPSRSEIAVAEDPAWSPDDSEIYVAGQPAGQPDQRGIYAVRSVDGSGLRVVAQGPGPETEPVVQAEVDLALDLTTSAADVDWFDPFDLTARISNLGGTRVLDVELRIELPDGIRISGSTPAGCELTGTVLTCDPLSEGGFIDPGGTLPVTIPLFGEAYGTYTLDGVVQSPGAETSTEDNVDSVDVAVGHADVALSLTAVPADLLTGEGTILTATITNLSANDIWEATLTLTLPDGLDLREPLPAGCTRSGEVVTCVIAALEESPAIAGPGARTIRFEVTGSAAGAQQVSAVATAENPDPDPASNSSSVTVLVTGPDLGVVLAAAPTDILLGEQSVVTATVTNVGGHPVEEATLVFEIPPGLELVPPLPTGCTSAPPFVTCTDLAAGEDGDAGAPSAPVEPPAGGTAVEDLEHCVAGTLPANDDASTEAIALPFAMDVFGQTYTSLYVNNNGNVTFTQPASVFTPFDLTGNTGTPMIAPFFADVDTRPAPGATTVPPVVTYGSTPTSFCVNWVGVGYYSTHHDKVVDAQLLIEDLGDGAFRMTFNYGAVGWETGDVSGGDGGFGGTSVAVGYTAGTGADGTFVQFVGSLVPGALVDGGPRALAASSRNSDVPGRYVFTVREGALVLEGSAGGTVRDAAGSPVPGAEVSVCAVGGDAGCVTTVTRADGSFSVVGLPVASYRLTAAPPAASGLRAGTAAFSVAPGLTTVVDVVLPPAFGVDEVALTVRGPVAGSHPVTATLTTVPADAVPANDAAAVTVVVRDRVADLAVTVTLAAPVQWVGGQPGAATFTVTNTGPFAADAVRLTTAFPTELVVPSGAQPCLGGSGAVCELGSIPAGDSVTLVATLTSPAIAIPADPAVPVVDPVRRGQVTASVTGATVDPDAADDTAAADLEVRHPQLRVLPGIGRPGEVVLLYGEQFPPGEQVQLRWNPGITTTPGPFVVEADGTLRVPVLIVRRDVLGVRALVATSDVPAFGPVEARMLVVPPSVGTPSLIDGSSTFVNRG